MARSWLPMYIIDNIDQGSYKKNIIPRCVKVVLLLISSR